MQPATHEIPARLPDGVVPSTASQTPLVSFMANWAQPQRGFWGTVAILASATVFLVALAFPLLKSWFWQYTQPDSYYGYALFVPVLVVSMLWSDRVRLRTTPLKSCPAALLVLLPTLCIFVVATKLYMQAVMSLTFLLTISSGVWFVAGTRFIKVVSFPLLFLLWMAPLPGPILNDATIGLQKLSTSGASVILSVLGFAPQQQGNIIHLSNYAMEVDVPCSGFKLLFCLLTFGAAFAYLCDLGRVRQFALFAVALPLSIALNSFRIALIGIVGECAGASAAHAFHDWSGMIMLALCMVALFGMAKGLGCQKFAGLQLF